MVAEDENTTPTYEDVPSETLAGDQTSDKVIAAHPVGAPRRGGDWLRTSAKVAPFVGLAAVLVLIAFGVHHGTLSSRENLQHFVLGFGWAAPLCFLVLSMATVVFPIIPAGLLVVAAPLMFGPIEGFIVNYIAVCAGSIINFAIARSVGVGLIRRLFSEKSVDKYMEWTGHKNFTRAFTVAILLPVAPDDLLCYLAGTTAMKWRTYLLIILLCKPPTLLVYSLGISELVSRFVPGW